MLYSALPECVFFCLSFSSCNVMSRALSCFRKPWLGRIQRCCRTCSIASTTVKLCFIIRYAKTRVADLLRPITQCTRTLSRTKWVRFNGFRSEVNGLNQRLWFPPELTLCVTEGLLDELGCRAEVLWNVEGGFVFSFYSIVLDVYVAVVFGTSQDIIPLPFCCVQDVCNTELPQARLLQSRLSVFM